MDAPTTTQRKSTIRRLAARQSKDDAAVESWRTQVYRPLNAQRRQIRVLKLFPSTDIREDPEGELFTLDLINVAAITTPPLPYGRLYSSELGPGTFAALSYAWGDATIRRNMLLNGTRFEIGKNAHEALRYLRKAKKAIDIWIDTICINQADIRERSQQVPLMKEIYSLACPVYIWTGPGLKHSYKALGIVSRMAQVMIETKSNGDPEHSAKKRAVSDEMRKVTATGWDDVVTFVNLPIWRRVWVQQEVILSSPGRQMALVVAGKFELNHFVFISGARAIWTSYDRFLKPNFITSLSATQPPMEKVARAISALTHIHDCWMVPGSLSSQTLFAAVQYLQATDPKVR